MNIQELEEILGEMKQDKRKKIVEGKRDKEALNELGIKNIETLKQRPLRKIASETKGKEVVLLTDFDRRGKEIASKLIKLFRARGVKTALNYKKKLGRLKGISEIEEIPAKYREIKNRGD